MGACDVHAGDAGSRPHYLPEPQFLLSGPGIPHEDSAESDISIFTCWHWILNLHCT